MLSVLQESFREANLTVKKRGLTQITARLVFPGDIQVNAILSVLCALGGMFAAMFRATLRGRLRDPRGRRDDTTELLMTIGVFNKKICMGPWSIFISGQFTSPYAGRHHDDSSVYSINDTIRSYSTASAKSWPSTPHH